MKAARQGKGMTLVEVLISLAILGVLLVVLVGILSGGLLNITNAGQKTSDEFTAHELMQKAINDPNFSDSRVTVSRNVSISIDGCNASVTGRSITVTVGDVTLTTFVADGGGS
ncbi:prepilin-type N-terminal cleavage/methylation domain-containing protein [Mahella sp.]|uniref:prepilin-type N-terminal cleavage/methylation domain-containing protein n=1 Tax=Mahella sp. TaxID=2798721 RepID=UPI0025C599BF|nr:prepilin-type N-terminal cleavage/methylation domain-containing protein [Mahella sp.]MBZ4665932.1 hypothetical protein [Mahella sp.]